MGGIAYPAQCGACDTYAAHLWLCYSDYYPRLALPYLMYPMTPLHFPQLHVSQACERRAEKTPPNSIRTQVKFRCILQRRRGTQAWLCCFQCAHYNLLLHAQQIQILFS